MTWVSGHWKIILGALLYGATWGFVGFVVSGILHNTGDIRHGFAFRCKCGRLIEVRKDGVSIGPKKEIVER